MQPTKSGFWERLGLFIFPSMITAYRFYSVTRRSAVFISCQTPIVGGCSGTGEYNLSKLLRNTPVVHFLFRLYCGKSLEIHSGWPDHSTSSTTAAPASTVSCFMGPQICSRIIIGGNPRLSGLPITSLANEPNGTALTRIPS